MVQKYSIPVTYPINIVAKNARNVIIEKKKGRTAHAARPFGEFITYLSVKEVITYRQQ